jgi:hypothetical protein
LGQKETKGEAIQEWLSASAVDLRSAKVLYDNNIFSTSLYHLQQSNEKLAKALLLNLGFLTVKTAQKDYAVQKVLGFIPKEPARYSHRTLPSLLSDLEKAFPAVDGLMTLVQSAEFGPKTTVFRRMVGRSKKSIRKLKKKPISPVRTKKQLEVEVKAAQTILDRIDSTMSLMAEEAKKIDGPRTVQTATKIVEKAGFDVKGVEPPSFEKTRDATLNVLKITILSALSVAVASLLDPLEAVTRYPDSKHSSFDDSNPYVIHFKGLYEVVSHLHEKSSSELSIDK